MMMTEPLLVGYKCCFDKVRKVMLLKAQGNHVADLNRLLRKLKLVYGDAEWDLRFTATGMVVSGGSVARKTYQGYHFGPLGGLDDLGFRGSKLKERIESCNSTSLSNFVNIALKPELGLLGRAPQLTFHMGLICESILNARERNQQS
jgi:hypothetical protein